MSEDEKKMKTNELALAGEILCGSTASWIADKATVSPVHVSKEGTPHVDVFYEKDGTKFHKEHVPKEKYK